MRGQHRRRLARPQRAEVGPERVEPVGVDQQRRRDPRRQLADEAEGVLGAAEARPEDDAGRALGPLEDRRGGRGAEPAADVVEADRHHLGQLRLEDRLERSPGSRRSRSRRRPGSRRRDAMHGAPVSPREPPTTKTSPELNFVDSAPRRGGRSSDGRCDRAGDRLARGAVGDPDRGDDEPPGAPLARARRGGRPWRRGT